MAEDEGTLNNEFIILGIFCGLTFVNPYFGIYEYLADWLVLLIIAVVVITLTSIYVKLMGETSSEYDWDSF
ncbi:hypothetical protein [Halorubrum lipolyticum]|uniref:Uncharacterized protein n=1 Tax=Halorubrum lipolyticum DSM 21995 TaxID=1227482 RepID=M0P328_9EURY|nr:hypothetical protein [Halorubrum lipolyticum]EMA63939.1 hypothetical protein C469_02269 [Halorubrum lipolyticum DSM 21995]